jgi:transposase
MKKHTYKTVKINAVDREQLAAAVRGAAVVVGIDVAKDEHRAAIVASAGQSRRVLTLSYESPGQLREFVALLHGLPASSLAVALEPTGTYGDPLRFQLSQAGIAVYRVSPKRAHDACEVFDGVPSSHDAKMAGLVAKLHEEHVSEPWPLDDETRRELKAATGTMARYGEAAQELRNQLAAKMARHWPEADSLVEFDSASLLALLARFGGPAEVARDEAAARQLLVRSSHGWLKPAKVEALLASARTTAGLPPTAGERAALRDLATELARQIQRQREADGEVKRLAAAEPALAAMGEVVGLSTAAVLFCEVGDPRCFPRAGAYAKADGLNIKERSSGKYQGQKKITKRGSGRARQWLYLAVLRLLQKEPLFAAWYERKVARDAGVKMKAIVALMRKLIVGLWHVGHGEAFDPAKLFDVRRLQREP